MTVTVATTGDGGPPPVRAGLLVVVTVLALAVAGCTAPTAPGETPDVATDGDDLAFDPGADYARLRAMLSTNVTPPASVRVLNESAVSNRSAGGAATTPAAFRALGVTPEPDERERPRYRYRGETSYTGRITLYPGEKPTPLVRTVLVHEYVHYLQVQREDDRRVREAVPWQTTDGGFVYRAVLEGVAVDVTDAYLERHVPDAAPNSRLYDRFAAALPRGTPGWYGNAIYVYGARYVDGRVDDPAAALSVAADPPTTSEQVIHGYRPGEEPPRDLSVAVDAEGSPWRAVGDDRMGEAFVRVALGDLSPERAATAAEGWGNDHLQVLRREDAENASYAWLLRWDDAANATAFERAYRASLSARGEETESGWRADGRAVTVERVSETTVAVLVGTERFVTETAVRGGAGSVTVVPPGGQSSAASAVGGSDSSSPPSSVRIG